MGWGRTLLLGDIGNRLDIEDTERDVARVKVALERKERRDMRQDRALEDLEREHEELKLVLVALVRTLAKKDVLSEEEVRLFAGSIEE